MRWIPLTALLVCMAGATAAQASKPDADHACPGCAQALRVHAALSPLLGEPVFDSAIDSAQATLPDLDSRLDPALFGAAGCNGPIRAVAITGRRAFLGGDFSLCADQPAANVTVLDLDSGRYASLGGGVDGVVDAMTLDGDRLYLAGRFQHAGGQPAAGVALWDGLQWQALAQQPAETASDEAVELRAMAVYQGQLHLAGRFDAIDGVPASNIARLDATGWMALGAGLDDRVNALAVHGPWLAVGGRFQRSGDTDQKLAAFWDGQQWLPQAADSFMAGAQLGLGCDQPREVRALLQVGGELIAGGLLTPVEQAPDAAAAVWRDGDWLALEMLGRRVRPCRDFIGTYDYDFDGLVALSGEVWGFGRRAGSEEPFLVRPDGGDLHLLDSPALTAASAEGASLLAGTVGRNGPLHQLQPAEGGDLRLTPLARARVSGAVHAVLEDADGLLVGGEFSQVAGIAAGNIARWDGIDWAPLGGIPGNGVNGPIFAMTHYQGSLYVAGEFSTAGGIEAANIARWDGQQWHALGAGLTLTEPYFPARALALREYQGELLVGGRFNTAGEVSTRALARWDGSRWSALMIGAETAQLLYTPFCPTFLSCQLAAAGTAVHGLVEVDGVLHISGWLSSVSGITGFSHNGSGVLRYDGSTLSSFGPPSWDPDVLTPVQLGPSRRGTFNPRVAPVVLDGRLHFAFDPVDPFPPTPAQTPGAAAVGSWDAQDGERYSDFVPGDLNLRRIDGLAVHDGALVVAGKLHNETDHQLSAAGRLQDGRIRPLPLDGLFSPSFAPAQLHAVGGQLLAGDLAFGRFPLGDRYDEDGGAERRPRLSADGRTLVLEVAAQTSRVIRRREADVVRIEDLGAMVVAAGLASPDTAFSAPDLSADGLSAAFEGSDGQIYLLRANRPQRISSDAAGAPGNGVSRAAALSPSGRLLAFASTADNLGGSGASVGDGQPRIHLVDVVDGSVELLSPPGTDPSVADDGSVAWISDGQVVLSRPGADGRVLQWISHAADGSPGDAPADTVRLSGDGRHAVFSSAAGNLVAGDDNGVMDVFHVALHDGVPGTIRRVSSDSFGRGGNAASHAPDLSDDGRFVAFHSEADNLVELDDNGATDVFVHALASGETRRINAYLRSLPEQVGASTDATLSADGSTVGFITSDVQLGALQGEPVFSAVRFSAPSSVDGHSPRRWPSAERLPLPSAAETGCPGGYHIAVIEDGALGGVQPGSFGLELLLQEPGRRVLAGGLNFGSLISRAQPGFAAFNVANAAAEPQRLHLQLFGHGRSRDSSLPVLLEVQRQQDGERESLLQRELVIDMQQPFEQELLLQPGFYVIVVHASESLSGNGDADGAVGSYFLSATTRFDDRPGGGFQGGAVVGGHHDAPLGEGGVSGFAGVCLPEPADISARVIGLEAPAAADLRLRLLDAELRETVRID